MVICLELSADVHTAQLMPLPLTVSCFTKIQIGVTFLVPAYPVSPGKRTIKRVCVCTWMPSAAGLWHWYHDEGTGWSLLLPCPLLPLPHITADPSKAMLEKCEVVLLFTEEFMLTWFILCQCFDTICLSLNNICCSLRQYFSFDALCETAGTWSNTHPFNGPLFWDYLGEPVPER